MPRDASGVYSLPAGYLATTGETILASQHNPPLEDLASAMSSSLPRSGAAPMTAAFKASDGTASAPGITFAGDTDTGLYLTASGFAAAVGGVKVAEFGSGGIISGATPIGAGSDFWGTTAPAGWLFAYGQAVSRSTYSALFAVLGTTYGAGDGSTTFNLPDKRGRGSAGKDDMGGVAANRLTSTYFGASAAVPGAVGGSESQTLTEAQLPSLTKNISASTTITISPGATAWLRYNGTVFDAPFGTQFLAASQTVLSATAVTTGTVTFGSGGAHPNVQPTIICNYIIFAGA